VMLDAIAGYDPDDAVTAFRVGKIPKTYTSGLAKDGLSGARLGVLTDFVGHDVIHQPVDAVVETAVAKMTAMGATIVSVSIPGLDNLTRDLSLINFEFKPAFNAYLAALGARAPVKTLNEFIARGEFHPALRSGLRAAQKAPDLSQSAEYKQILLRRNELRQAVMTLIASNKLDALLYPHQMRLVVPIGEEQVERNGVLSQPSLTVTNERVSFGWQATRRLSEVASAKADCIARLFAHACLRQRELRLGKPMRSLSRRSA
jgi:amidase